MLFFLAGVKRSSGAALPVGLRIFVAMGIGGLLAAGSGLVAANLLAGAAWLDPDALSVHRHVGILTVIVLVGLGGLSGVLLHVSRTTGTLPALAMTAVLVLAIAGVAACMWAGYLGGALRHTELGRGHSMARPPATSTVPA